MPNAHYKAWGDQQQVDELERNVGRDLQFIRIIGTLVGAKLRACATPIAHRGWLLQKIAPLCVETSPVH
jgi:hypothetical protein